MTKNLWTSCVEAPKGKSRKLHQQMFCVIQLYRVTHLVANLGWVDFDLGNSTILLGR